MAAVEKELRKVISEVASQKRQIARQRNLIQLLEDDNRPTGDALAVLDSIIDLLTALEARVVTLQGATGAGSMIQRAISSRRRVSKTAGA